MEEELSLLIDLLRSSKRPSMRLEAARQLAERKDIAAAPALLEVLEESNNPTIIPVVTVALGGLQVLGPGIAPQVLAILNDREDPRRVFMPLLLASVLGEGALPRLIEALTDDQLAVRTNAATQLGQIGAPAAFEPLLALVEDELQDAHVRGVAASALGSLREARALPALARLSTSADPELLAGAIDGLAETRDPAAAPYLEAILERGSLDERTNRAVRLGLLAMERYRDQ